MEENLKTQAEGIERQPLHEFTERAYLDYSMYVVLDRALPHIADGLKPVQRRIVYAMAELGLTAAAKPKKSARTVGDVIGKFHPHGDAACYEAMVLMAQPFAYRYPLIDGQGNFGSPDDPKSFAAMRYTEARLARYAELLLAELSEGTVDWQPNFDGTLSEPKVLPARVPNVLVNGATGIAVGMATDIPPHNLREVAAACMRLLADPAAGVAELCEDIRGPDFPTAAEVITPHEELVRIYETGSGTVRQRAVYELEDGNIVITALPYQTSGAKVLEQIAAQMSAKKLPWLEDLRDESDHETPTRLVLVPRSSRVDLAQLMAHLFATTDLERSYRVNLNVIGTDGLPRVKDLKTLLAEWLEWRLATVRRRLQHRLGKVLARLHVLEGLRVAYLKLDEVIAILRQEEEPKAVLMERLRLSEAQAEAILELRLRQLARLEEMRIRTEEEGLAAERAELDETLASPARLKALVKEELRRDAEAYGDARRSPIVARAEAEPLAESELVAADPVTVVLSQKGWVRAAKGHDIDVGALSYRTGDGYLAHAEGRANQAATFIDSTGRCYTLPAHTLPSARGFGEPLSGRLAPPEGAGFAGVMVGEPSSLWVLASDAGYGFVAALQELYVRHRTGKAVLSLPAGARVLVPVPVQHLEEDALAVLTRAGRLLIFPVRELPRLARGKGVKLVALSAGEFERREDFVVAVACLPSGASLKICCGQRFLTLKPADLKGFAAQRGRRGSPLPRGYRRVERVVVCPPAPPPS